MKRNSLLLWILIPVSCMTNYVVYAETLDPLDPSVVVEESTPTETIDLIEPDPWEGTDPTIQEEVLWEEEVPWEEEIPWEEEVPWEEEIPWEEEVPWEEPIDIVEEPVDTDTMEDPVADAEEPVSSTEPLLESTGTGGIQSAVVGGLQSAVGGLQSAVGGLQSTLPLSTSTDNQNESSSSLTVDSGGETDVNQPVIAGTTSSNLPVTPSTSTDNQNDSSSSPTVDSNDEIDADQPVIASTTSSDLPVTPSTSTGNQNNSSTSSGKTQVSQPVISNTSNNQSKASTPITQTNSTSTSKTSHSNSNQSNSSSSTSSNNTTSKASSTQSKPKVSTTTSSTSSRSANQSKQDELTVTTPQDNSSINKTVSTKDNDNIITSNKSNDSTVQDDNAIVTTQQNNSTTTNKNSTNNSKLSKDDLSTTTPKINPVPPSAATQQKETLDESDNEPEIQTIANENQPITPKSSPAIKTSENATTQPLNDRVVIVADNSVLPNTFSVDAEIGPHQVFLIHIGEGYSKPAIVEHLSNSQVFIKGELLTYVPNLGFVGIDTFSYQVIDSEGKKVVRQVRVKVNAKDELVPVKNCQLYSVNDGGDSDSQLLTVAPPSKSAIKLGPAYYTFDIEGMAIHPTTGLLYATSGRGRQNIFDGYLYRVNPETGGITIIGDTGFSEISSLAFHPDGTLWSWARKGSKDKSKPIGLIKIDLTTAQSQFIFAAPVDLEGLAWDSEGKILYGTEQTRLWAFDGKELHQQCSNFSSEVESLETSVNGMLLFGTNEHHGSAIRLYDPAICEEITGDSFATPSITGDFDIESLAWPLECQSAMTKATHSDKDSHSTETSNAVSDNKACTGKDKSNCSALAEVDNQKTTRSSEKLTPQPATTCSSDTIGPCPALDQEEAQRFFTENLKADFLQLEPDGLVFVSLNGQLHYGFFSYPLSTKQVKKLNLSPVYEVACERNDSSAVTQLKLGLTKDIDSEGHDDFVITYCDGRSQMLFYLGIKEEDIQAKKSNSNPKGE